MGTALVVALVSMGITLRSWSMPIAAALAISFAAATAAAASCVGVGDALGRLRFLAAGTRLAKGVTLLTAASVVGGLAAGGAVALQAVDEAWLGWALSCFTAGAISGTMLVSCERAMHDELLRLRATLVELRAKHADESEAAARLVEEAIAVLADAAANTQRQEDLNLRRTALRLENEGEAEIGLGVAKANKARYEADASKRVPGSYSW
jgi:hypothetical protein